MKKIKGFIPGPVLFSLGLFFTCFVLFTFMRLVFLWANYTLSGPVPLLTLFHAIFNRGVLYDLNISSDIISIPFILLFAGEIIATQKFGFNKVARYASFLLTVIVLLIYAVDIPFFNYYNSHVTKAIFSWIDHPLLMLKALFSYSSYLLFFMLFLLTAFAILVWIDFLYRRIIAVTPKLILTSSWNLSMYLTGLFLIAFGMRGDFRLHCKPLLAENALFSNYAFANQLGMNPVFTFFESYSHNNIDYFQDSTAIQNTRRYLKISERDKTPVARKVNDNETVVKRNIVIIIMESMSADIMGMYGQPDNLTPFLDSIAGKNICFYNTYTDGIHTYNGVFSTLFGMPSVLDFKPTKNPLSISNKYAGISEILHPFGYRTIYFCSGNKDFDNMNFFLKHNDFDEVIGEEDYSAKDVYNSWGVADKTLYGYVLKKLNEVHHHKQPFMAAIMTISSHIDYTPPQNCRYKAQDHHKQAYEYADQSLRYFFKEASKEDWYDSTVFVLIADHGQNFDRTYDLPLSYHHTPFIIVAPFMHQQKKYKKIALQIDVFPTVMGILKIPYVNNTLGIDLMQDSRPFAYFSGDDKIGCLNDRFFLVIRKHGQETLYRYKNKDLTDYKDVYSELADSMKSYVYSMYQTAEYMINKKKTALPQQ